MNISRIIATAAQVEFCEIDASKDTQHPNKMPFTGTLVILDSPSSKPPNGAMGHRIIVPKDVATKRLKSLIGMGLNYAPDEMDHHSPRHKVGVITSAWIEGDKLKVKGVVWKKDFPEAEKDLKASKLGMSMELGDVYIRDKDEDVWHLTDFQFTGATALYKSAAAYYQTALAASREALGEYGGGQMAKPAVVTKKKPAASSASSGKVDIATAIRQGIAAGIAPLANQLKKQGERLNDLASNIEELQSLAASSEDVEEEEEEEVNASAADVEEEEEEIEAAGGDEEDEEIEAEADDDDVDAATVTVNDDEADDSDDEEEEEVDAEQADVKPGKLNKGAKNRGNKTTVTASHRIGAVSAAVVKGLKNSNAKLRNKIGKLEAAHKKENRALRTQVKTMGAQIEAYAEKVDRRTLTPEVLNLMEKGGHDVRELMSTGKKLSTEAVDEMLANSGIELDVPSRMAIKNELYKNGLMDTGEVRRFQ